MIKKNVHFILLFSPVMLWRRCLAKFTKALTRQSNNLQPSPRSPRLSRHIMSARNKTQESTEIVKSLNDKRDYRLVHLCTQFFTYALDFKEDE